ncbi:MAG: DNA-binding response regulator, partial [Candidatus Dadabacteria bacterium]
MSEKIKALVVTQDGGKVEQLRASFEALPGFEVREDVAPFSDCLSRASQFNPDVAVVFLDEQPGSAGCLILEQLKKTRDNLFVFAVSSERSAELIVKAIRAGADELISTMPSSEELLKAFVRI